MADQIFDLYTPYPKQTVEGPRRAIVAALEETYFLTDTALELVSSALAAVDALTVRVDALEAAAVPPTAPTPEVAP